MMAWESKLCGQNTYSDHDKPVCTGGHSILPIGGGQRVVDNSFTSLAVARLIKAYKRDRKYAGQLATV